MKSSKVLFVDSTHSSLPELLSAHGFEILYQPGISREAFKQLLPELGGIIIRSRFILNDEILEGGNALQFIGRVGSGMENIDIQYCQSKGIQCFNSPEGNRQAVAEHALGMLLGITKKITKSFDEIRQNEWNREANRGEEMYKKTIGIIGYGNTGSSFASLLSGFNMNILVYDKYKHGFGTEFIHETDMDVIFREADILSLHIPYNSETHHLVTESYLTSFQKPIYLLNTSRGSIIQTPSLVKFLQDGRVKGAGLDVLEYEDHSFEGFFTRSLPKEFEMLRQHPSVILTPHIGGWTYESNYKLSKILAEKIINTFCH